MEQANIEFVELQIANDTSVLMSTREFRVVVDDIERVRSFLRDEDLDTNFSYWADGAVELSYAAVEDKVEIDITVVEVRSLRHLRRTLSRDACLSIWNRFASEVEAVVRGLTKAPR
jgi:hypothetical protein